MRRSPLVLLLCLLCCLGVAPAQDLDGPPLADAVDPVETVGGLRPPSAVRYADPGWYDLLSLGHSSDGIYLELAAVDAEAPGTIGLLQPILEVYVDLGPGGLEELLPGSTLAMPSGRGWELAYRVTGDGAWLWQLDQEGVAPSPVEAAVTVDGRRIWLAWPGSVPGTQDLRNVDLYAISGVYDPFREEGWRPFERSPSPWAFSSAEPWPPVVDVLPGGAEALEALRLSGRLQAPAAVARRSMGSWVWWALMGLGLALGVGGLVWRSRVGAPPPKRRIEKAVVSGQEDGADISDWEDDPGEGGPPGREGPSEERAAAPAQARWVVEEAAPVEAPQPEDDPPPLVEGSSAADGLGSLKPTIELPRPPRYVLDEDLPLLSEEEEESWDWGPSLRPKAGHRSAGSPAAGLPASGRLPSDAVRKDGTQEDGTQKDGVPEVAVVADGAQSADSEGAATGEATTEEAGVSAVDLSTDAPSEDSRSAKRS